MGEVNGEFNAVNFEEEVQIHEWEIGLPNVNDITPLNKGLVPLELLTAFNISPEPYLTAGDVTRASEDTLSSIRGQSNNFRPLDKIADEINGSDDDDDGDDVIDDESGKKPRRNESPEDAGSATPAVGGEGGEKAAKRARLVWTPQLHKRFVDVVGHLGIKNAVPKTIMQLMNVEGLTRENVASHLQKYRLYLKRMGAGSGSGGGSGGSFDSPSGSAPDAGPGMMVPMSMSVPMPMMMGMGGYNGYHNQYNNGMVMQSGSGGNKFGGSGLGYHHHDHTNPNQGSGGQMMN